MVKKIIIAFVAVIAFICIFAMTRPSEMFVVREATINASPEAIFPYINSAKKCEEWMVWKDMDPKAIPTYSGPDEGVGSTSSWDSPGQMGTGQAVVVESIQNQSVKTQLSYTKPMKMEQLSEITLSASPNGTVVRWSVTGRNNFLCKVMGIFMNVDKMVGGMFEKGLANLKMKVEG